MKVIQAKCPGCQRVLRIPANLLGESMRCKQCGKVFQIRSSSSASGSSIPAAEASRRAGKKEPTPAKHVVQQEREAIRQVETTEEAEQPVSESDVGVLPADQVYSPALSRYRKRSAGGGPRLAVLAVVALVLSGVAGAVYLAVKTVNSEPDEKTGGKINSSTIANFHSTAPSHPHSPKGPGKNGPADANQEPSLDSAPDETPFPRRALFICVSNYLYANPVSYGSKTRTL